MTVRRRELAVTGVVALVLGTAPTVGDIGACGTVATALDQATFAAQRKALDCQRCSACSLQTGVCQRACDPTAPSDVGWPVTCHPLQHDGDVCLRALEAASCSSYASFVSDTERTVPGECEFCLDVPDGGLTLGE